MTSSINCEKQVALFSLPLKRVYLCLRSASPMQPWREPGLSSGGLPANGVVAVVTLTSSLSVVYANASSLSSEAVCWSVPRPMPTGHLMVISSGPWCWTPGLTWNASLPRRPPALQRHTSYITDVNNHFNTCQYTVHMLFIDSNLKYVLYCVYLEDLPSFFSHSHSVCTPWRPHAHPHPTHTHVCLLALPVHRAALRSLATLWRVTWRLYSSASLDQFSMQSVCECVNRHECVRISF